MIKADVTAKVKAAFVWFVFALAMTLHAAPARAEEVKDIHAEEFNVSMKRASSSGRVVLFEDPEAGKPRVGKVLLIKQGTAEIAAVRVLKLYSDKFAAKVVLPFKDFSPGSKYLAIKKIGDKLMTLIREREKRVEDPDKSKTDEQLAGEVSPDDSELDRGIKAPEKAKPTPLEKGEEKLKTKEGEPLFDSKGEELGGPESLQKEDSDDPWDDQGTQQDIVPILDPYDNALSLQYASIKNVDGGGNSASYKALGGRFTWNFARMMLLKKRTAQDILSLDVGAFFYSITAYQNPDDALSVLPIIPTLRYSILLGNYITIFGYGGLIINTVPSSTKVSDEGVRKLSLTKPVYGLGGILNFGPGWALRADYGSDMFGIGVMLKF